MARSGMTIPFDGVPLHEQRPWMEELVDLGYTDAWSSEAQGTDAFVPLALTAVWAPALRLGTAIVPAFTRGPALLAQSVATMTEAAPGRFAFGIGTSSNVIVENWNAIAFDEPYQRTRDMVRFLRAALTGDKVDAAYHGWLGRGPQLKAMWGAWKAGDRKAAAAAIPDQVVDELIVHGPPEACREHIGRYVDNGVTTTALAILPFGIDVRQAVRDLSPAAGG